jgi:hypothetical protein
VTDRFTAQPGEVDPDVDPDPRAIGGQDRVAGICWDGWTTDPEVPTYGIREEDDAYRFVMQPGDVREVVVRCAHCGFPAHPSCRCGPARSERTDRRVPFDVAEWAFRPRLRYQSS